MGDERSSGWVYWGGYHGGLIRPREDNGGDPVFPRLVFLRLFARDVFPRVGEPSVCLSSYGPTVRPAWESGGVPDVMWDHPTVRPRVR